MRESDSMRKRGKKKEEEENGTFFTEIVFSLPLERKEREREREGRKMPRTISHEIFRADYFLDY